MDENLIVDDDNKQFELNANNALITQIITITTSTTTTIVIIITTY